MMTGLTTSHVLAVQRSLLAQYQNLQQLKSEASFLPVPSKDFCHCQFVRLGQIEQALAAIEEGEYGICIICHQDIEPARLGENPLTVYCDQCQCDDKKK
ncbi:TraR/DksA family transcriptional regulator [Pokkaliibacter sp. CJK22405]|uniref:TraR/DksA family transcriptional regulator n=1 Tax=Pokkaliibacter sp. CJK22405 TaxID=3384615 RepID=UPI003984F12B